jgi:hypothetical protein
MTIVSPLSLLSMPVSWRFPLVLLPKLRDEGGKPRGHDNAPPVDPPARIDPLDEEPRDAHLLAGKLHGLTRRAAAPPVKLRLRSRLRTAGGM